MRVKVKDDLGLYYKTKMYNYLTLSLTFAQNSFTSSMNSCNINAKKATLTLLQKCQGQLRSSLKILGQKSLKLSTKSYELDFPVFDPYKKVKVNPRSLFEQSWSWMGCWT